MRRNCSPPDAVDMSMRALQYNDYGSLDVLHLVNDAEVPEPGPGQVRVAVRAASVNPIDWKIMAGKARRQMPAELPAVPGFDMAGVVDALGPDVHDWQVGDEVMADNAHSPAHHGTMAEYTVVDTGLLARKPAELSFVEAASLPLAALTAAQALDELGLQRGETLLVHNGSGGVGSYAVQIGRHLGARVLATSSPRNHDRLRELGAEPLAYGDGLVEEVRRLVPEGVDVVFDAAGGVLDQTLAVLADGGRHGSIVDFDVADHGGRAIWTQASGQAVERIARLAVDGALRPQIDSVHPLSVDAYRRSMEGHAQGKVVVEIS